MAHYFSMDADFKSELLHNNVADSEIGRKINLLDDTGVLIVGLGGTGSRAVASVTDYMVKHVNSYSNFIRTFIIDSDNREISRIGRNQGMNLRKHSISYRPSAAAGIAANPTPSLAEWLHPEFAAAAGDFNLDGCDEKRAVGRFKLYTGDVAGNENDQRLRGELMNATAGLTRGLREIVLITGISGGTGSGIFNDIAMLLKEIFPTARLIAYIMLPDTVDQYKADPISKYSLYQNGYAALKELNYYVTLGQRTTADMYKEKRTSRSTTFFTAAPNNQPYDLVYLVSGERNHEQIVDRQKNALDTITESLINAYTANVTGANGAFITLATSVMGNRRQVSNNYHVIALNDGVEHSNLNYYDTDSFLYSAIGVKSASIPQNVCNAYIVHKMIEKASFMDPADSHKILSVLGADDIHEEAAMSTICGIFGQGAAESLQLTAIQNYIQERKFECNSKMMSVKERARLTVNEIKDNSDIGYNTEKEKAQKSLDNILITLRNTMLSNAQSFVGEKGPHAFHNLYNGLYHGAVYSQGRKGLKKVLEDVISSIDIEKVNADRVYADCVKKTSGLREAQATPVLGRLWDSEYVNAVEDQMTAEIKKEMYEYLTNKAGVNQQSKLEEYLINPLEDFEEDTKDLMAILDDLSLLYENLAADLGSWERFRDAGSKGTNFNPVQDERGYKWVKGTLDNALMGIAPQSILSQIADEYYSNDPDTRNRWHYDENNQTLGARERFEKIVEDKINDVLGAAAQPVTLLGYIRQMSSEGNNNAAVIVGDLIDQIIKQGAPLFNTAMELMTVKYLYVPNLLYNDPSIQPVVDDFCNSNNVTLCLSSTEDKIVCYSIAPSVGLYWVYGLAEWERAYNEGVALSSPKAKLLHRNLSGRNDFDPEIGLSWYDYPSCRTDHIAEMLAKPVAAMDESIREENHIKYVFLPTFEKALQYGIIREEIRQTDSKYVYKVWDVSGVTQSTGHPESYGLGGQMIKPNISSDFVEYLVGAYNDGVMGAIGAVMARIEAEPIKLENSLMSEGNTDRMTALYWCKRMLYHNPKLFIAVRKSLKVVEYLWTLVPPPDPRVVNRWKAGIFCKLKEFDLIKKDASNRWCLMDPEGNLAKTICLYTDNFILNSRLNDLEKFLHDEHLYAFLFSELCGMTDDATTRKLEVWNEILEDLETQKASIDEQEFKNQCNQNLQVLYDDASTFNSEFAAVNVDYAFQTTLNTDPQTLVAIGIIQFYERINDVKVAFH